MESKIIYWTTKTGQKINIDEMEISHLRNTLKMIVRNIEKSKNQKVSTRNFKFNGDIAQNNIEMMEDAEYYDDFHNTFMGV
jgi:hypothetical protein